MGVRVWVCLTLRIIDQDSDPTRPGCGAVRELGFRERKNIISEIWGASNKGLQEMSEIVAS